MNCSVNLVPVARLHARRRARRRTVWIIAGSTSAVLLATGWGIMRTASEALTRLSENVGVLQVQRTEVQRRLVLATARRARLLEQLQSLAAARRPQPWAPRLVALTREAPENVFLTAIQISAPVSEHQAPAGTAAPSPSAAQSNPPASPSARAETPPGSAAEELQTVRLLGYALDHGSLLRFLNTLQGLPGWRQVELVRAAQEPFGSGLAVVFELECRTAEDAP